MSGVLGLPETLAAYCEAVALAMCESWSSPSRAFPADTAALNVAQAPRLMAACWRAGYPPAKAVRAYTRFASFLLSEGIGPDAAGFDLLSDSLPYPTFLALPSPSNPYYAWVRAIRLADPRTLH